MHSKVARASLRRSDRDFGDAKDLEPRNPARHLQPMGPSKVDEAPFHHDATKPPVAVGGTMQQLDYDRAFPERAQRKK